LLDEFRSHLELRGEAGQTVAELILERADV
jgi:hypothetical protein